MRSRSKQQAWGFGVCDYRLLRALIKRMDLGALPSRPRLARTIERQEDEA
jgi:hypothetical protein